MKLELESAYTLQNILGWLSEEKHLQCSPQDAVFTNEGQIIPNQLSIDSLRDRKNNVPLILTVEIKLKISAGKRQP